MKRAAWIQSLSGFPFSRMAEPIMAADQAIAHSKRVVNDCLEDEFMFCFLSTWALQLLELYALVFAKDNVMRPVFLVKT